MNQVCVPAATRPFYQRLWSAILAILFVWFVWRWMVSPFLFLIPQATVTPSYAAMFVLGLVASVSTCLASTGAFLMAFSGKDKFSVLLTHSGRLVAFALGGALLGGLGQGLALSTTAYGFIGIFLAIVLGGVALYLFELLPKNIVSLPMSFGRFAYGVAGKKGRALPPIVGAVTFILPCGFTQAAQGLALASGSAQTGAIMMSLFALGTLPVLVVVSLFGSLATLQHRSIQLATGGMLALFAVAQLDGALTILGSPVTFEGFVSRLASSDVPFVQQAEQVVRMQVAYGAFSPNKFVIKKGVPVRWVIDGVDISGCASTIVAPTLNIRQALIRGENLIRFTPLQAGTIPFSCSMGMIRGSFFVVE